MSQRIQLSNNFYLDEFTRSQVAARAGITIIVAVDSVEFERLKRLCQLVLQPVRDALGPVHINSGYRPPVVNRMTGGANSSQHCLACAADFDVTGHSPLAVSQFIEREALPVDQCIHEFGEWTHASVTDRPGKLPRQQFLTAYYRNDQTQYTTGIHTLEALV